MDYDFADDLRGPEPDEKPVTILIAALLVASVPFAVALIWILWGAR